MVLITGDTHGRFDRLMTLRSLRAGGLRRGDCLIICGDFGGVWFADGQQERVLDQLARLPYTVLFADGNHENFDCLETYPVTDWNGGRVQVIRRNVLHLMRGEIYEIEGKSYFVLGGAASHDLWNGVLDPASPDFIERYRALRRRGAFFRVKGASWWPQELPSEEELARAWVNLQTHGMAVDVVITHCAPTAVQDMIARKLQNDTYVPNLLTDFLQLVWNTCQFGAWYCGHYHREMKIGRLRVLHESLVRPQIG